VDKQKVQSLPKFQQLQLQMTEMIRCPEKSPYQGEEIGGLPVEPRRLAIYQSLFLNNVCDFMSSVFPVLSEILGEQQIEKLARDFLKQHRAQTPLFHELGQEFLQFLSQFLSQYPADGCEKTLPPWAFELAHYEWVELALMVAEEESDACFKVDRAHVTEASTEQTPLQLCPTAWPLSYQWPVDEISVENAQQVQPQATFFLIYRNSEDGVEFIKLTSALFQLLWTLWQSEVPLTFDQLWGQAGLAKADQENTAIKTQAWQSVQALMAQPGILISTSLIEV